MVELANVRQAVQQASSATDDSTMREQLRSIDESLMKMIEGAESIDEEASTEGKAPHGDNLEEIEKKLSGLVDEADEETRRHVHNARNALDAYRRTYTHDW